MKSKSTPWLIPALFFCLAAALNLYGKLFFNPMAAAVKPALLPLLSLTTLAAAGSLERRETKLLVLAQLLGCVGDVFLLFSGFRPFLGGMAAFGAGHGVYLVLFGGRSWKGIGWKTWAAALAVMLAFVALIVYFVGAEGTLLVPMYVYGLILTLLIFSGLAGVVRERTAPWWYVTAGAVLFTLSDAMIAYETFHEQIPRAVPFLVMLTYLAAQALLAAGGVKLAGSKAPQK